jgi:hypothetical protein
MCVGCKMDMTELWNTNTTIDVECKKNERRGNSRVNHAYLLCIDILCFDSPCIVISVVEKQTGQMIDLGFSENEMMDECLPLMPFDGDCNKIKMSILMYVGVVQKRISSLLPSLLLLLL